MARVATPQIPIREKAPTGPNTSHAVPHSTGATRFPEVETKLNRPINPGSSRLIRPTWACAAIHTSACANPVRSCRTISIATEGSAG